MKKLVGIFCFIVMCSESSGQKIEEFFFNLYTDSLKKGFYNYINIDGRLRDGSWMPLDSSHIIFSANTGHFNGNDIFIDSSYKADTIKVKAILRSNPAVWKEIVIHIRKRGFEELLKSNDEILNDIRNNRRKNKEN